MTKYDIADVLRLMAEWVVAETTDDSKAIRMALIEILKDEPIRVRNLDGELIGESQRKLPIGE